MQWMRLKKEQKTKSRRQSVRHCGLAHRCEILGMDTTGRPCLLVGTHTHTHTHTHTRTHTHLHLHTRTHIHTRTHKHTHLHIHTHQPIHTHTHTHIHLHTHTLAHTYTCTHTHTHTLTHTQTCTNIHAYTCRPPGLASKGRIRGGGREGWEEGRGGQGDAFPGTSAKENFMAAGVAWFCVAYDVVCVCA